MHSLFRASQVGELSTAGACRPTQDPAIDTFKIEYLLGGSAVMALIANYELCVQDVLQRPIRVQLKLLSSHIMIVTFIRLH